MTRLRATVSALEPAAFAGPWTSPLDRSPIRRSGTGGAAGTLLAAGLRWGRASLAAGDRPGALAALAKLDSLATTLGASAETRAEIEALREATRR